MQKTQRQAKFEIELSVYNKIKETLVKYRDYEIGGILIGYQKGKNYFSISNITVADDIGKFKITNFIREPMKSMKILIQLFKKKKYNYIGEWHSHPRFDLYPSKGDIVTMNGILADSRYNVNFALLLLVRLNNGKVDFGGFLFHRRLQRFIPAVVTTPF